MHVCLMDSCKCGLGKSVDHESILKSNALEIKRLRWSEPFKVAKPKVIGLLDKNISITTCIGGDVSNLQNKLAEYENKKAIRKGSQLGPRKMHPDTAHSRHRGDPKKKAERRRNPKKKVVSSSERKRWREAGRPTKKKFQKIKKKGGKGKKKQ